MNKTVLSFFAAWMCALQASAQLSVPDTLLRPGAAARALTTSVLTRQAIKDAAARSTGLTQRITAMALARPAGNVDSTVYIWNSNRRGAQHNPKVYDSYFDSYSPYAYSTSNPVNDRVLFLAVDSTVRYTNAFTATPLRGFAYNAANQPTRVTTYGGVTRPNHAYLSYDAAGYNSQCRSVTLASGALMHEQQSTYDGTGKRFTDSTKLDQDLGVNAPNWYSYSYDTQGKLTTVLIVEYGGSGVPDSLRNVYQYNTAGLLERVTSTTRLSGSNWTLSSIDSFAYSGANPAYTSHYVTVNDQGVLKPYYREVNTLNGAGYWSQRLVQMYDDNTNAWANYSKTNFTYNSYNNYQTLLDFDAGAGGLFPSTPDRMYRFYYQTYDPESVETNIAVSTVRVLPNPAQRFFYIDCLTGTEQQEYRLLDATGTAVWTSQSPSTSTGSMRLVDVSNLPKGLYFLVGGGSAFNTSIQRVLID